MTNVYSKVKQNYESAENPMLCATKEYLCCTFMSWAGLDNLDTLTLIDKKASDKQKTKAFVEFDIEKAWREQQEQRNCPADQQATTTCASFTVTPNLAPGTYTCTHGLLTFVNALIPRYDIQSRS